MKRNQWILISVIVILLFLISIKLGGITMDGIHAILPNYILISTAIFVISFAVYVLQLELSENLQIAIKNAKNNSVPLDIDILTSLLTMFDRVHKIGHSNESVLILSTVSTLFSIAALFFSYLTIKTDIVVIPLFYLATFTVILSIFEMLVLAYDLTPKAVNSSLN